MISRSRVACLCGRSDFRAQGVKPIARAISKTAEIETPHLAAIMDWVRRVPVSSRAIAVLFGAKQHDDMTLVVLRVVPT